MKKKKQIEMTSKMAIDYLLRIFYRHTIFFFTRLYPFSQYLQDSIYHYKNKRLKVFEDTLIKNMVNLGFKGPTYYVNLPEDPPFVTYYLMFFFDKYEKVLSKKDEIVKFVAKDFNINKDNIFLNVTEKQQTWKLQIPYEDVFNE